LDPWRPGWLVAGRPGRHRGTCLPAIAVPQAVPRRGRSRSGTRGGSDADLHGDGGHALFPAGRPVPGARLMRDTLSIPLRPWPALVLVAALVLLPPGALAIGQPFYLVFATRVLIYALIASSLNLLIGYGGMVSFGHAAFMGAGAYTVAVLMPA